MLFAPVLILAFAVSVLAGPHRLHTRSSQRLCGEDLADTMSLVCNGNFASPGKRSGGLIERLTKFRNKFDYGLGDWNQNLDVMTVGEADYQHGGLLLGEEGADLMDVATNNKQLAFGLLDGPGKRSGAVGEAEVFYRNVRGIVEECCHKPCSYTQMRQYCGAGKRSSPMDLDPIK